MRFSRNGMRTTGELVPHGRIFPLSYKTPGEPSRITSMVFEHEEDWETVAEIWQDIEEEPNLWDATVEILSVQN